MTLTERINSILTKRIKEEKRLSQVELAKRIGVAPASINKWMKGGSPAVDKLPLLCEILEITPNQLFGYKSDDFPIEAADLYKAFKKHPEYRNSIEKLLDLVIKDIELNEYQEN